MEIELIELVKQSPFIYDKKDPNFKDTSLREKRWTEIALRLGKPEEYVKKRWKTLRDKYHRDERKNLIKKKWKYSKQLQFLKYAHTPKITTNKCKEQSTTDSYIQFNYSSDLNEGFVNDEVLEKKPFIIHDEIELKNDENSEISTVEILQDQAHNCNRNTIPNCNETTAIRSFFHSMALHVEEANLPFSKIAALQMKILKIVNEEIQKSK